MPSAWAKFLKRRVPIDSPGASAVGVNLEVDTGCPAWIVKVHIQWKQILLDTVQRLGAMKPVYSHEDTTDGRCQVHVSLRFVLNKSGSRYKDISVVGPACYSILVAENAAAVVALKELQHGCTSICLMDVSSSRCKEILRRCYKIFVEASELYKRTELLLTDWKNGLYKTKACCSALRGGVSLDLEAHLAAVTNYQYLKLQELSAETKEGKDIIRRFSDHCESLFSELSAKQVTKGPLPKVIQLSMKQFLEEIMSSLEWPLPSYDVINLRPGVFVCLTSIYPNVLYDGVLPKTLNIYGREVSSEEACIESSCECAISELEQVKGVCLVDLNFAHRAKVELYAADALKLLYMPRFVASRALGQWKLMADEILRCKQHYEKLMMDCSEDQFEFFQKFELNFKAVAGLHKDIVVDIQTAEKSFKNAA